MNVSKAKRLLALAAAEPRPERLTRHLLIAAALREAMEDDPIVVGGTAEEFWTAAEYHETDLDVCASVTEGDRRRLAALGFEQEGRHWYHPRALVAVEFPEARIEGDETRTHEEPVASGSARIIGLDDLYLDRLRQATVHESREGVEFHSALAVAAARYESIDWPYVAANIRRLDVADSHLANSMRKLDSRIRRRARQALSKP